MLIQPPIEFSGPCFLLLTTVWFNRRCKTNTVRHNDFKQNTAASGWLIQGLCIALRRKAQMRYTVIHVTITSSVKKIKTLNIEYFHTTLKPRFKNNTNHTKQIMHVKVCDIKCSYSKNKITTNDNILLNQAPTITFISELEAIQYRVIYPWLYFSLGITRQNVLQRWPTVCSLPLLHSYTTAQTWM